MLLKRGFTYTLVGAIALLIAVPVGWVLVASLKTKGEFYGSPWALPEGLHWRNYTDAFLDAAWGNIS